MKKEENFDYPFGQWLEMLGGRLANLHEFKGAFNKRHNHAHVREMGGIGEGNWGE
jgi:hypothetical protein